MTICGYEWRAPRVDVLDSVLVRHVCMVERSQHTTLAHHCSCGANIIHGEDKAWPTKVEWQDPTS